MLKFFRKIRQQLLVENKLTHYFFYAIGEIVLVVIGILIALSINNWNTNQINRQEEKVILSTIVEGLKTDLINSIGSNIDECEKRIYISGYLIDNQNRTIDIPDSVKKRFIDFGMNREFYPVITPFKILESKGLDLLTNENLKYNLIHLYGTEYKKIEALILNESNNLRDIYRPELRKHFKIYPPGHEIRFVPVDQKVMLEDRYFMNAATVLYANNAQLKDLLNDLIPKVQDIISQIELELYR
jgi:hypothetical protein